MLMHPRMCLSAACLLAVVGCDDPEDVAATVEDVEAEEPVDELADEEEAAAVGGSASGGLELADALRPQTIIGGTFAGDTEFPFAVHLKIAGPSGTYQCGGSLVAANYVLSAAHCFFDTSRAGAPSLAGDITATIDRADITYFVVGEVRSVSEIIRHPRYDLDPGAHSNDLAVLRLSSPSTVTPIELAAPHSGSDRYFWLPGAMARVIGWGRTVPEDNTSAALRLQKVDIPVMTDAAAAANWGAHFNPAVHVSAGDPTNNKGACRGDSGGPVIVWTPTGWRQFAVVSWGSTVCQETDGVYARIGGQRLHRWLRAVIHETPAVGDVNGDGRDDILTFTHGDPSAGPLDVYVALSNGSTFGAGTVWSGWWAQRGHVPAVGDFNGDGRDDIWAFTGNNVYVALSTGSSFNGGVFNSAAGTTDDDDIGRVGDVDGDGRADAIVFAGDATGDVHVMLSTPTGFGARTKWHEFFAPDGETPMVGDVNGDGRDDIVTFTQGMGGGNRVYVALSTGTGFGAATIWHSSFAFAGETPAVANFNGGPHLDIATFVGNGAVHVGTSNGGVLASFTASLWDNDFGDANDTFLAGDVNGDGRDDILRFTQDQDADVFVALSTGVSFHPSYKAHDYFAP